MTELIPQPSDPEQQKPSRSASGAAGSPGRCSFSVNKGGGCACGRYDRRPAKVMQEAAEKLDVPYPLD